MLLGSCFAGMAFANAPVAAVHALAYPLGSHFKIPHGLSNALVLPHVLRFNSQDSNAAREYDAIADICQFDRRNQSATASCSLADGMQLLARELEVPTTLSEVGVGECDIEMLSTEAMKQQRLLPNNPVEVELEDCRMIYNLAL
jgi:alcohol dehydrogenase class IV